MNKNLLEKINNGNKLPINKNQNFNKTKTGGATKGDRRQCGVENRSVIRLTLG
jgi:hypothetical protein